MNHRKRTAACFSVMVLSAFFIQGCAVVRWHNRMMQSAMECMGMGSHGDHGDQPGDQAGDLTSPGLCQAATHLDYKEALGLTPDQIEKLKDLNLSCQKELNGKDAAIKTARLDYQVLLGDLVKNNTERPMVEAKGKEIGELYAGMLLIPLEYREKAAAILTAEQKERLGTASKPESGQHKH